MPFSSDDRRNERLSKLELGIRLKPELPHSTIEDNENSSKRNQIDEANDVIYELSHMNSNLGEEEKEAPKNKDQVMRDLRHKARAISHHN